MLPFGTSDEVRKEIKNLKAKMGRGGGYILAPAKQFDEQIPIANIAAYLEEANLPRL